MNAEPRPVTRAEAVKTYLASHAGMPYCVRCITAALDGAPAVIRTACIRVRDSAEVRDTEGVCTTCGKRRLVLTAILRAT